MTAIAGVFRSFHKRFLFRVEIAHVKVARFTTFTEPRAQIAVVEQHEGGALIPNKGLGKVTFPNVTLTRGMTDNLELFAWFQQTVASSEILVYPNFKQTLDVVQENRLGVEIRRWTLMNCFPVEYTPASGGWDGGADENTIEEVILAYDFFMLGGDRNL